MAKPSAPKPAATLAPTPAPATPLPAVSVTPAAPASPTAAATSAIASNTAQILSVDTKPSVVHAGESVRWDVRTTPDIVAVTAHVSAYTIPLKRTAPGRFALDFSIPANVPAIFHGTYNLDVMAQSASGATAKRTVTMTFQ